MQKFDYTQYDFSQVQNMFQADALIEINYKDVTTGQRVWNVMGVYKIDPSESLDAAAKRTFESFCLNMDKDQKDFIAFKEGVHYTIIPKLNKEL